MDTPNEPQGSELLAVLSRCGLRIGEALSLTWSDIDLDSRTMRVHPKTASSRDADIDAD